MVFVVGVVFVVFVVWVVGVVLVVFVECVVGVVLVVFVVSVDSVVCSCGFAVTSSDLPTSTENAKHLSTINT